MKDCNLFQNLPVLSPTDKVFLDKPISILEIQAAVMEMAEEKSPGEDGFPAEFYKRFWPFLKDFLFELYKEVLEMGGFLGHTSWGLIKLIPKPGKNLLELKNWRPITLLNVDYKIISKTLANRFKLVIQNIVHENQAGFIKGRFIGENVRFIQDITEILSTSKKRAIAISLDIEKAFDSLDHNFVFTTMQHFGIGEKYI